jgi:phosphoserine aminotransferase
MVTNLSSMQFSPNSAAAATADSAMPGSKRAGEELTKPTKPTVRPACVNFGSGPCKKRPGWSLDALAGAALGRSHRSALGKGKLEQAITQTKELLRLPPGYEVGIVPASDTGAVEMVMWSMLGPRPVRSLH